MVCTQIQLTEEQSKALKKLSVQRDISVLQNRLARMGVL